MTAGAKAVHKHTAVPSLDQVAADPCLAAQLPTGVRSCLLSRCAAVLANLSATLIVEREPSTPPSAEEYLKLDELVDRIKYGNSTIRAWAASGYLKKGEHYIGDGKKRRYLLNAITSRLSEHPASDALPNGGVRAIPFVRKGRCRG